MVKYILSRKAEANLLKIYASTEVNFGKYQADAYHAGLQRTFDLLSDFPRMGASAGELGSGLRRFRFQSHYIFYIEDVDYIFIRALISVKMNVRPELFE